MSACGCCASASTWSSASGDPSTASFLSVTLGCRACAESARQDTVMHDLLLAMFPCFVPSDVFRIPATAADVSISISGVESPLTAKP